ncbi:REP-associated tyrosine transposase [Hyphococcus luteus]|uniref:Transposase n=1 Tax=Hyphococcus luteus TaxID=2058213 RepID=A0A2S7JZ97_9PROT|nr:transposase [Marinicaulis flavus]PQA85573.1 transposase [Marinicaulis flavus]
MPNYRRVFVEGGTYFFTVNLRDRRRGVLVDRIADMRAAWRETAAAWPVETVAAVVLPDHLHFIWRLPEGDSDFSTRIRLIKAGFTRRLPAGEKSDGRKGERGVFQSRFWEHLIRDESDFDRHVDYVHFNPVKHGYVTRPEDWPHSTFQQWRRETGRPITTPPEDWRPCHLGER